MDFLKIAEARHSVRQFESISIEPDKIKYILECARLAPSAVNRQPWYIKIATSTESRIAIQRSYPREWFTTAPCYIIICVDRNEAWVRGADNKSHAEIDGAIIAEHICLAATSRGLGSCWVCNFDPDTLATSLSLASNMIPVAIIPIGYPTANSTKPTTRKSIAEIAEYI